MTSEYPAFDTRRPPTKEKIVHHGTLRFGVPQSQANIEAMMRLPSQLAEGIPQSIQNAWPRMWLWRFNTHVTGPYQCLVLDQHKVCVKFKTVATYPFDPDIDGGVVSGYWLTELGDHIHDVAHDALYRVSVWQWDDTLPIVTEKPFHEILSQSFF